MTISRARLLTASACLALAPRCVAAQELQKVRLAGSPDDAMTPVVWAMHSGAYRNAGLDVEYVATRSGSVATAAVVAGTYEFGKGSAISSMIAHLRDLPLWIIGNGVLWDPRAPSTLSVVAADAPYQRPRDLTGKIGGVAGLNDVDSLVVSAWVDRDGGDSKSIKWVEIPNSAIADALAQHRVDIGGIQEPLYTESVAAGKIRPLAGGRSYSVIAPSFAISVYFTNKAFAQAHPEAVRAFMRVTYESARYTNAHHAETESVMSEFTKIPLDVMKKINRPPGATSSDSALLQPLIDFAARYGSIARAFPAKEAFFSS
jgi:NitT/TauT family transport system substrate-binding protein